MTHSFHVHVNIFNFQASYTPPPLSMVVDTNTNTELKQEVPENMPEIVTEEVVGSETGAK